jgi:Syntaxin
LAYFVLTHAIATTDKPILVNECVFFVVGCPHLKAYFVPLRVRQNSNKVLLVPIAVPVVLKSETKTLQPRILQIKHEQSIGRFARWAKDADEEENDEGEEGNIEMGKTPEQKKEDIEKAIFFQAVEQIKNEIDSVIKATSAIEKINEQAIQATTTEHEQELSKRLKKVLDGTNKQAKAAKNLLGELKSENEKLKESGGVTSSDLRYVDSRIHTCIILIISQSSFLTQSSREYAQHLDSQVY